MIYVIYDFDKMQLTTEKYKQLIGTLNVSKTFCIESFYIQPVKMNYNIHVDKTKITCEGSSNDNGCFISTIQVFIDNDSGSGFKSTQCVLCTIENPRAGKSPAEQDSCRLPSLPDAVIHYGVRHDSMTIFAPTLNERVLSTDIVSQFISRIANDDSVITGDMNFLENFALNADFWQHVFDIHDADRFENLIRALRISMVGLFYDKCGDTPDEVLNCDWFKDLFSAASRKDAVLADIIQHFTQLKNEVGVDLSHRASCGCGFLNEESQIGQICPVCRTACGRTELSDADKKFYDGVKKEVEQHFAAHGGCGYMSSKYDEMLKNNDRQRKVCRPDKDPCKPPKWLIKLYSNPIDNDGELPEKVKLHRLLSYMIDYTASWTECCDARSAQQMKDILPLLMRCKLILEGKK